MPLLRLVATNDANFHDVITEPGSYYLSRNLSVTKANGISIAAPGVMLDLNGFQISRRIGNGGDGILVREIASGSAIKNGSVKPNDSAGVRVITDGSWIEGNNCIENDRGIYVTGAGNLIVKNSASQNALNNYQIAESNRYGPTINATGGPTPPASGNESAGTLGASTNPWANFAF